MGQRLGTWNLNCHNLRGKVLGSIRTQQSRRRARVAEHMPQPRCAGHKRGGGQADITPDSGAWGPLTGARTQLVRAARTAGAVHTMAIASNCHCQKGWESRGAGRNTAHARPRTRVTPEPNRGTHQRRAPDPT